MLAYQYSRTSIHSTSVWHETRALKTRRPHLQNYSLKTLWSTNHTFPSITALQADSVADPFICQCYLILTCVQMKKKKPNQKKEILIILSGVENSNKNPSGAAGTLGTHRVSDHNTVYLNEWKKKTGLKIKRKGGRWTGGTATSSI